MALKKAIEEHVVKLAVEPMELDDVQQVLEVDRESYTIPWPASAYRREILHNRHARYWVLREFSDQPQSEELNTEPPHRSLLPFPFFRRGHSERVSPIAGYAGMWLMVDEAHITTIAMREAWRGRGLGELLLATLIESATDLGARRLTLEVRVSNEIAQGLYQKYGFHNQGVRNRYYSDNNEDAFIMTTNDIHSPEYLERFTDLLLSLANRLRKESSLSVTALGRVGALVREHGQGADSRH